MAVLPGIRIAGIACNVPSAKVDNLEMEGYEQEKLEKIIKGIGVRYRYKAVGSTECTSDLCYAAAHRLIKELGISRNEIGAVVMVTQSADYILPATSCILQDRLKLPTDVMAFDVNLGCSGFVYGLYIAGSILLNSGKRYALLLAGDTSSEHISPLDQSAVFLFGDAGSATILENNPETGSLEFLFNTDGSGAKHLMIEAGASRCPITTAGLEPKTGIDGNVRADNQLYMDGMEIFNFAIDTVVDQLRGFMSPVEQYDAVVFHQANHFMLESMRKMLRIPKEKFLYSLYEYGNTSSASIPVTICMNNAGQMLDGKYLLAGFGVGLSLGFTNIAFNSTKIFSIEAGIDAG